MQVWMDAAEAHGSMLDGLEAHRDERLAMLEVVRMQALAEADTAQQGLVLQMQVAGAIVALRFFRVVQTFGERDCCVSGSRSLSEDARIKTRLVI